MTAASRQPPEIIEVDADTDEVRCDGGSVALGHPVTFYSLKEKDSVRCGYCDRLFVKKS